jgi:predicted metal-dependent enzyme (double-stranded beta helix superfamily)
VWNALPDAPSISIHVYGGNIGAVERATFAPDGTPKRFISGYANTLIPNIWDKSTKA